MNIIDIIKQRQPTVLRSALASGAILTSVDDLGRNALHWCSILADSECSALLLKAGVDLNLRDNSFRTPLNYAIEEHHNDIANLLINAGASLDFSLDGFSYLHNCSTSDNSFVASLILSKDGTKSLLSLRDRSGQSRMPLHWAAQCGSDATARVLLEAGADVSALADGFSPLHIAVGENHSQLVQLLLDFKADVNQLCPACANGTALHLACAWNRINLVELLINHGSDRSIMDDDGLLARDYTKSDKIRNYLR